MKKTYIRPEMQTFSIDVAHLIANSLIKGGTIENTSDYLFLGRDNDTNVDNKSIWDSAW